VKGDGRDFVPFKESD